jgi:hypothetical protein
MPIKKWVVRLTDKSLEQIASKYEDIRIECACGCGTLFIPKRVDHKFFNQSHNNRHSRKAKGTFKNKGPSKINQKETIRQQLLGKPFGEKGYLL